MELGFDGIFPIDNLLKIVRAIPGDTVTLVFENDELKISFDKTKMVLKSLTVENWKEKYVNKAFEFMEGTQGDIQPIPQDFVTGLKSVVRCAADDKNGSILNNVAVIGDRIIGTDNYKIGHYTLAQKFDTHFLIDTYNVQPIIDFNPENFVLCEDRLIFGSNAGAMMCAISPMGKYPDFLKVIAKIKKSNRHVPFPDELPALLYLAQQLPGINDDTQINIVIGKNKLMLDCKTLNGRFKKNIRIDYDDAPINFHINLNTLRIGILSMGNGIHMSNDGTGMMNVGAFDYVFPIEIED